VGAHANQVHSWGALASNLLRNASQHAGTPWPAVNDFISRGVIKAHLVMGFPLNDPRTTNWGTWKPIGEPSQGEDTAGNTLFASLLLIACMIAPFLWGRLPRAVGLYTVAVVLGFLLYALVFKWQGFGSRLVLHFFLASAPIVAAVAASLLPSAGLIAVGVVTVLLAWPWYLRLDGRPLLPEDGTSGILLRDRASLIFPDAPELAQTYTTIAERIRRSGCQNVAVMFSGDGGEYPLWLLLGAPRADTRIEWLVAESPTSRFATSFTPCAVVCEDCGKAEEEVRGLGRVYLKGRYALYLAR
jgi:hypothetical protein